MFRRATESVVKNCGEETLHPVTDLNSSERFKPLCLVEKQRSFWPFKKPIFIPTCVKLSDLLNSPADVEVVTKEVVLLKSFKDVPTLDISGSVDTHVTDYLQLNAEEEHKVRLV